MNLMPQFTTDCTPKCRSHSHALQLVGATIRGTFPEIRAFSRWLCCNFSCITDVYGRNLLHIAASCGKWEVLKWLLEQCHVDVDTKDSESGWTALHRALFYGHLTSAKVLMRYNASLQVTDNEGLTPLEIVAKDRPSYINYSSSDPSEVYVWGCNLNFNLGLENEQARTTPELVEKFRRENTSISKVVMCKYHTVFMSNDGRVFTCGLGNGGRLGVGNGETLLLPTRVRGVESRCSEVAAAEDHLIMLTDKGRVWTCGLNTYHQLGHMPPPEQLLTPRPISNKILNTSDAIGVCAAHYHSVVYTKQSVFTFGLNAGQLGHPKGERLQTIPRMVSTLNFQGCQLSYVTVSDGATICGTTKGDIYVLHQYQCRKIASKQLEMKKLSVVGGHLDSRCCIAGETEGGNKDLTILLLTISGKVFLWQESMNFLQRCIFAHSTQIIVADAHLNFASVAIVSTDASAFIGYFAQGKAQKGTGTTTSPSKPVQSLGLVPLLDKDNCKVVRVKRIPYVHRGTSITSDVKGSNFAVIQSHPKTYLLELPTVSSTRITNELKRFCNESDSEDKICDMIIQTGNRKFPVHKYILASRSDFFRKKLSLGYKKCREELVVFNLDSVKADALEQILEFIYTNNCPLLAEGQELSLATESLVEVEPKVMAGKKASKQPKKLSILEELLQRAVDASAKLAIPSLVEGLKSVKVVGNKMQRKHGFSPPKMTFPQDGFQEMCNVHLKSSDGVEFPCHKCLLVARSEYFSNMFRTGWIESSSSNPVLVPFTAKVLGAIVHFVYTDDATKLYESEDTEFLCQVLVGADHMLITRLKEMCEVALVDMITLKNVMELLELSHVYNASQLKCTCIQYIYINLPPLLEANSLEILSDEVVRDLNNHYRSMVSGMCRRFLTPYCSGPTAEELEWVGVNFPIDEDVEHNNLEGKVKSKRRYRIRKTSEEPEKNSVNSMHVEEIVSSISCLDLEPIGTKTNEPTVPRSPQTPTTKNHHFQGTWNIQKEDTVPDLKEIMMKEEQSSKKTACILVPPPTGRTQLSQKQRKQMTEKQSPEPTATGSCWSQLAGSPPENPWKNMASPVRHDPVMKDIISSEIREQEDLTRIRHKSLDLISVEEKAIEELLVFYKAAECVDEKVTVVRVLPERTAVPLWRKH